MSTFWVASKISLTQRKLSADLNWDSLGAWLDVITFWHLLMGFFILEELPMLFTCNTTIQYKGTRSIIGYPSICSSYCFCPSAICSAACPITLLGNDSFSSFVCIGQAVDILLSFRISSNSPFMYPLTDDFILQFTILPATKHFSFPFIICFHRPDRHPCLTKNPPSRFTFYSLKEAHINWVGKQIQPYCTLPWRTTTLQIHFKGPHQPP